MFFLPINAEQYPLRKTKETDVVLLFNSNLVGYAGEEADDNTHCLSFSDSKPIYRGHKSIVKTQFE